ncbi:MAG: NUDIX domain-containing protein [Streptomyces sp.]|uniref:NUDIX domain-containing protein n=1 Tax=Streptomyces sp. TaxID=1931 RepID=UPI003D6BA65E
MPRRVGYVRQAPRCKATAVTIARRAGTGADDLAAPVRLRPLGWELPGGLHDAGGDPRHTAARELREEGQVPVARRHGNPLESAEGIPLQRTKASPARTTLVPCGESPDGQRLPTSDDDSRRRSSCRHPNDCGCRRTSPHAE